ncbi:MAG TPA: DUF4440 domain-containing protein [Pseudoxanthomonas sp.]
MTHLRGIVLFVALFMPATHAIAAEAAPAPPPPATAAEFSAEECVVWARELSFARAVAEHDAAAFASHLQADTAFNSGKPQPLRGREVVTSAWGDIIAGKELKLLWYPTRATIGGPGDVAWSSGPALFEWPGRDPAQRFAIGTYHSVWHKDADGVWRILFDEGAGMKPADETAVKAFHAGRSEACPPA